jgi:hypothetical protein
MKATKDQMAGVHGNDDTSVENYFNGYAKMSTQQYMISDNIRTNAYMNAIMHNK